MATTIKDLLTQAAVIRDAAAEGENTAMRVGSMLIDLVRRIVDTLSADALSALGLRITASAETVTVIYKTVDAGGTARDVSVALPAATTTTAGMMSSASLAAINKASQDILALVKRIDASDVSIKTAADAAKVVSDALAAHETADANEHTAIRKSFSDSLASAKQEQHETLGVSGVVAFDGFVGDVSDNTSEAGAPIVRDPQGKVQQGAATVHFSTADGVFYIKQDGTYYPTWTDDYMWQGAHQTPWSDKAYYNVADGKLYKIGTDNQLHEIALTMLRDDIGILPCRVRTAAPLSTPMTGYPTAHNYTIWWSQTSKAFFAAVGYDQATIGDAIEGCEYYKLGACDEYTDYCTVTESGAAQTATPRTDRIYRDGNVLWQYDKTSGQMVKMNDISGGTYDSVHLTGYSEAETLDAQQIVSELVKADMVQLDKNDETAGLANSVIVQAQTRGMSVDWETSYKTKRVMTLKNMRDEMIYTDGQETLMLGDDDNPLDVSGVRTLKAENANAKTIQATGSIESFGEVSGQVVHGDSATFCQGNEVKIDVNGNVSTEQNLTVEGTASLEGGATVGGELTCDGLTANSAEVNGKVMANSVETDGDITAGGSVKTSTIIPGTGSGGILEVDGQLVTKSWGVIANGDSDVVGNLNVSGAAYADELYAEKMLRLDKEDVGAMLVHVFHGIRQSLPSDYTAATLPLTPKTRTDGVADIIYVRDKKRFYAFWVAQKAYSERFDGDAEYNVITNNKPTTARTDRTWQWGADTYKYDTEAYISAYYGKGNEQYGADLVCVTDAGKALFIKMWRDAIYRPMVGKTLYSDTSGDHNWYGACDDLGNCYVKDNPQFTLDYGGYYPEWHETPGFFLNGITGIGYAEARQIYEMRTTCPYPRPLYETNGMRTNMMCDYAAYVGGGQDGRGITTMNAFSSYDVQVIRVAGGLRGQRPTGSCWIRGVMSFYNADSLEEVIGAVQIQTLGDNAFSIFSPFKEKLQYLWITGLSVSLTKTFAKASSINVDCLRYLVEKSQATEAKPISVTLHADVFAALPEDVLTLAETKHVTFVSA